VVRRWRDLYRSPRARSLIGLGCIALLLIAVNVLAAHYLPQRLDLTAERLYTLSPGTRAALAHIDEPITLHFSYSPKLGAAVPAYGVYAARVRALLDQYVAAAAPGKLRLDIADPEPFSQAEDRAIAFGLHGVPLDAAGAQGYFGLAGSNSTDDREVIAFFDPAREPLLEYDLTYLVRRLAFPQQTRVGDPVGLRRRGTSARPFEVVEHMQRAADMRYAVERRALEQKLTATQAKLHELMAAGLGRPQDAMPAPAQAPARAVEQVRADLSATRRQLRGVQAASQRNIARLKAIIEFVDIALAPILVAAAALVLAAMRRRRRRNRALA
jgi:ABC-type uncharacterized transport system involved in gliding motility auxiliary subunit